MASNDIAISVKNLTKTYRLFGHPGDRVKQFFSLGLKQYHKEFTALKDVSFEIKRGETVGIIGRNGSGKSTLLQLICGILKPTFGSVQVNGRISALLELGAGFNPEFTGRENVYFQGTLMGFTQAQMDERFDEIVAFADIGEFIEQPVRTYSSGMFVRLAFAVAIHVEPEILVIDEALAVGDVAFQAKCIAYFRKFQSKIGTMIIVSHDINVIFELCDTTIYAAANAVFKIGPTKLIVEAYQLDIGKGVQNKAYALNKNRRTSIDQEHASNCSDTRQGTGEARVEKVEIWDEENRPIVAARFNQFVSVRLYVQFYTACDVLVAYYICEDKTRLLGSSTLLEGVGLISGNIGHKVVVTFKTRLPLTNGNYNILAQLSLPVFPNVSSLIVDFFEHATAFSVVQNLPTKVWSKVYVNNIITITEN